MKPIILLLTACLLTSGAFCQVDNYYYYKGKKINININDKLYYIVTSDTLSIDKHFRNSRLRIAEKRNGVSKSNRGKKSWKIVQFEKKNINDKESVLSILRKDASLQQVSSVIGDEYPIAVSEYFYVKIKDQEGYKSLESMAKKMNCEIIGTVDFMPLWYILQAPSNANSLNIANYFYSTSQFQDVDYGFMFDFENTCINDNLFYQQWGLQNSSNYGIDACMAWAISKGDPSIKVAVVDQGIDAAHNEFSSNLSNISYDTESSSYPARLYGEHGTHVAGIIAANQNGIQISGVAPFSSLMSISHSLSSSKPTISQQLASGISWAWQNGADVISNSWGDQGGALYNNLHSSMLENAISDALRYGRNGLGCVIVFASGNKAPKIDYPAYCNDAILCVGSSNNYGTRSSFSGYGSTLDLVAPGENILSTLPNNQTGTMSGTSMAAPHVAGIAALILSINSSLTQTQVSKIIESTCTKLPNYSFTTISAHPNGTWNNEVGYGLVNAYRALNAVPRTISGPNTPYTFQQVRYVLGGFGTGSSINWSGSSNIQFIGGQTGPSVTVSFCGGYSATLTATVSGTVNQTFTKTVQINNGELNTYSGIDFMETHFEHPYAQCYDWKIGTNFTSGIGNGLITCTNQSSTFISRQMYGYDETIEVRAQANGCYTPWQRTSFQVWGPQIDEGASYLCPMNGEPFWASLVEPYPGYADYYWYFDGSLFAVTSYPSIQGWGWPCGDHNLTVEVGGASASASFWGMCGGWRYYSYPNPANDHLTIEVKEETPNTLQSKVTGSTTLSAQQTKTPKGEVILRLYDGQQQLVRNQTISSELKQVNINTAGLTNGTYFLNIIKDNKVIDRQTIIIKH